MLVVLGIGVFLGLCSRVLFSGIDGEMGIPLLIRDVLPIGIAGIVTAAYFSAIMSTADSCLMASCMPIPSWYPVCWFPH